MQRRHSSVSQHTDRTTSKKRRLPKGACPDWQRHAKELVRETPRATEWMRRLREAGIFDIMSNGEAVGFLLHRNASISAGATGLTRSDPLERAEQYAQIVNMGALKASVAIALANLQKFFVLSTCAVLLSNDTQPSKVFDIVRICIGLGADEVNCRRMIRGCQFVHELMDNLYMGGWGLCAFELLLVWNRSPSYYLTISYAFPSGLQFMKSRLCTEELVGDVGETPPDWMSIFAPNLSTIFLAKVSRQLQSPFLLLGSTDLGHGVSDKRDFGIQVLGCL
ncbi:hypothetical protein CERZMDRAFT_98054 [Cercospora zeae-maydis SCOH1-5]|uniref:Uncharacterized protein n=1 Tax=Cercospora zeae-maydis SCOH1-5 TaxID=717836 RepID=A0A6A6FFF4_9PEZI|nr:hypothetical protein CERZMDRAFT_98054 [Cercospora zeae-maydis SCOH1-5]